MTQKIIKGVGSLLAVSFISSCSSAEKEKLANSGVVLYPLVKAGEGVHFIGQGIECVSQPFNGLTRPNRIQAAPSEEFLKELDLLAVKYNFNDQQFGAGSNMIPGPPGQMLMQVESVVGAAFDWYFTPALPDVAAAQPGGVIIINPNVMGSISLPAQYLYLFHEAGHQMLNHTAPGPAFAQTWVSREREAAADFFAGQMLRKAGFAPEIIRYAAIDAFKANPEKGTDTHPPRLVRIQTVLRGAGLL